MNFLLDENFPKGAIKNKFVVAALAVLPAKAVTTNQKSKVNSERTLRMRSQTKFDKKRIRKA